MLPWRHRAAECRLFPCWLFWGSSSGCVFETRWTFWEGGPIGFESTRAPEWLLD